MSRRSQLCRRKGQPKSHHATTLGLSLEKKAISQTIHGTGICTYIVVVSGVNGTGNCFSHWSSLGLVLEKGVESLACPIDIAIERAQLISCVWLVSSYSRTGRDARAISVTKEPNQETPNPWGPGHILTPNTSGRWSQGIDGRMSADRATPATKPRPRPVVRLRRKSVAPSTLHF